MVAPQVTQFRDVSRYILVQVHPRERGHVGLVVGAHHDREPGALPHFGLECFGKAATDAAALVRPPHDHRVQLPHVAVVCGNAADPTHEFSAADRCAGKALVRDVTVTVTASGSAHGGITHSALPLVHPAVHATTLRIARTVRGTTRSIRDPGHQRVFIIRPSE